MIYVHVPFCKSFCTYCGFYSEVCRQPSQMEECIANICREAALRRDEMAASADMDTLYIGGGTPSVLPLSLFSRLVRALPPGPYGEFTVEVNPEDIVEKGVSYVRELLDLGVGRISMGVQSFDDGILRWMNRRHDADRARKAFRILREAGVGNISIDLIFGLSHLSDELWEKTVDEALELAPEHISCYQLSVEEGSALEKLIADGRYQEASEEQCRRQYDLLCRKLAAAGFRHYEVSNFARPGFEARHNSAYWRRVPYVGLGPGAHSLLPGGRIRRWNADTVPVYTATEEHLTDEDIRVEALMLALRTDRGIAGADLARLADPAAVERLRSAGAIVPVAERSSIPGDRYRIPEDHFFVSDEIIRELL